MSIAESATTRAYTTSFCCELRRSGTSGEPEPRLTARESTRAPTEPATADRPAAPPGRDPERDRHERRGRALHPRERRARPRAAYPPGARAARRRPPRRPSPPARPRPAPPRRATAAPPPPAAPPRRRCNPPSTTRGTPAPREDRGWARPAAPRRGSDRETPGLIARFMTRRNTGPAPSSPRWGTGARTGRARARADPTARRPRGRWRVRDSPFMHL